MLNARLGHGQPAPNVEDMNNPTWSETAGLGGRLSLLGVDQLDQKQRTLRDRLVATRSARGTQAGYTTVLPDGRLIGPFNAMLRLPEVGEAQLDWAESISATPIDPQVREVTILSVAGIWGTPYVLYAHSRAALTVGVPETAIAELSRGAEPSGLSKDASIANHLAVAAVEDHHVPDQLYAAALAAFGETDLMAVLALISQYLATCTILTAFAVPAPTVTPTQTRN